MKAKQSVERWSGESAYWPADPASGAEIMQLTGDVSIATNIYCEDPACSPGNRIAVVRSMRCDASPPAELWVTELETGRSILVDTDISWVGSGPQAYGDLFFYPRFFDDHWDIRRLRFSTLEVDVGRVFHDGVRRQERADVQAEMTLGGRLAPAVSRPVDARQRQLERRGINREDLAVEPDDEARMLAVLGESRTDALQVAQHLPVQLLGHRRITGAAGVNVSLSVTGLIAQTTYYNRALTEQYVYGQAAFERQVLPRECAPAVIPGTRPVSSASRSQPHMKDPIKANTRPLILPVALSLAATFLTIGGAFAAPTFITQPVAVAVTQGGQAVFSVCATGTGTLTYQWMKDGSPIGGATSAAQVVNPVQYSDAGNYTVSVTDSGGTTAISAAWLSVNAPLAGTVDFGFFTNNTVNSSVLAMAVQTDGKVLISGNFTVVNGMARSYLARLNSDGSTDYSFGNGMVYPTPRSLAVQSDGKVLIGGTFATVNGVARRNIARLNSDGLANWQEYVAGTDPTNTASRLVITAIGPALGTNYTETVRFLAATNRVIHGELRSWPDRWVTQRVYEVVGSSVTWPSVTGRVYSVEVSTNLLNWTALEGATDLPGRSPDNTFTDRLPSNVKFYRVKVRLP